MEHRAPTLEEVAIAAGVSRSTASRVINGAARVAPETQQAVEYAIERLGYVPNQAARSLVTRRTESIALVIPEDDDRLLSDPFLGQVVSGVNAAAGRAGNQLVLLINQRNLEKSDRIARYLRGGHVDGTIVVSHHRDDELEKVLSQSGIPAHFIGRPFNHVPGVRFVDVDNVRGGEIATQHLIDRGAKRIATITGPEDMTSGTDRRKGWEDALRRAGMLADLHVAGDFTIPGGMRAATELLDRGERFDGLFVASDQMAVGAMQVFSQRGLVVPDDIMVVGFDNLGFAESAVPTLATVQNPVREMADLATTALLRRISHGIEPGLPDEIAIIEPVFVPGQSA
ncbi:LacI family DNA-binding transcriptional regulator [Rarobacter faecitabidus]|uniref:LacI family transcriptional regulator n=2 Tax=Rarobacter faecitabidus TaxID=13243 RepID=A0A542ZU18_RARFA|nr:LacI family transcriptional regulator [Rarobacter faecitabidus]